jgi:hypothetical protein
VENRESGDKSERKRKRRISVKQGKRVRKGGGAKKICWPSARAHAPVAAAAADSVPATAAETVSVGVVAAYDDDAVTAVAGAGRIAIPIRHRRDARHRRTSPNTKR